MPTSSGPALSHASPSASRFRFLPLLAMLSVSVFAQTDVHPAPPSLSLMSGTTLDNTTDGSKPTTTSPMDIGPTTIPTASLPETVRALAVLGDRAGSYTGATFRIAPALPSPTFSLAAGSYTTSQSVVLHAPVPGSTIHYTVDGTLPTAASPVYTSPIPVTRRTSIIAFVTAAGYSQSPNSILTINIIPPTPFISPAEGTFTTGQSVTITDATPGTTIYYTTDGSAPTTASAVYNSPITIPTAAVTETIRAFAVLNDVYGSATRATYTITPPAPAPTLGPGNGDYTTSPLVTMTDSLPGTQIFYTVNGSAPTSASTLYTGPFHLPLSQTGTTLVKAIAMKSGYTPSSVSPLTLSHSLPTGVIAETVVQPNLPVAPIPSDFLGFSHEWSAIENIMGDKYVGVNSVYRTLVNNLASQMGGPLVIRVGGGSTDTSGPATTRTVEPLAELAQAENVKFILGVNLGSNEVSLAQQQASIIAANLPLSSLDAIEIGNEPDGYATNGYRPSSYGYPEFLSQFGQWSSAVTSVSESHIPVSGPTLGGGGWMGDAQSSVQDNELHANMITQHKYVACYYAANPLPANILLQPASSTTSMNYLLSTYIPAAHAAHVPLRVSEMNSICNGGQLGVSNSFSSALWAIDTMFEYAKLGLDGVNWNSNVDDGPYDLFHFTSPTPAYYLLGVNPLYYGLLFFADAAGGNSHLLTSTTLTNANLKVWATSNDQGHAHLVIINKEFTASGNARITLSGYSKGTVSDLTAPNYLSTNQVTLAGQTFDGSKDGTLQGARQTETVYPVNGVWSIHVPAMSAVSVDLEP